tara:strand:+ start:73 stop:234 length:162 start_codon:yes stop_codon:yes gene_type:complete
MLFLFFWQFEKYSWLSTNENLMVLGKNLLEVTGSAVPEADISKMAIIVNCPSC